MATSRHLTSSRSCSRSFHNYYLCVGSIRRSQHIKCTPEKAWEIIGDPSRLHEWFPIVSCRVEGSKRWIHLANGLVFEEDIVLVDNSMRRFQYTIVNNPIVTQHLGTVDVIDDGRGECIAIYSTDMKPNVLALGIGAAANHGLTKVKKILEGTL